MFYTSQNLPVVVQSRKIERRYRVFDILVASLALCVSAPMILLVALCIKISDWKAPVFFKQERIGRNGKSFMMYKFRSMQVDAEKQKGAIESQNEMSGPMFKMENDPRITRIGKWLRKFSIDEFPQFINVLQGDMSCVGPRPPLPEEVQEYESHHLKRLSVKPGCTGLWQVSGRNRLSFEEMVELDILYIKNQSIRLNIRIILRTFRELLGKGM
ncbi:sugar transferase [Listeria booriae]|uniref:sugar transferase n=1 Tax=Listeria booriae TaxID=1552123 RepID=UPI001626F85F|nr:sugar transferase [Listeria booriae]MBC1888718.1 sugar transferase [Listeria booriae]MBC2316500.1 sugar transferase [Listeria booriae]